MRITDQLLIPDDEITFTASRSSGPGGQNVNKVSSKVTLLFDVAASTALTPDQKNAVSSKLRQRINKDGILRVTSQRTRSQDANRQEVRNRFANLILSALEAPSPRIETKTTFAANQRRLHKKRVRTTIKRLRSRREWEE